MTKHYIRISFGPVQPLQVTAEPTPDVRGREMMPSTDGGAPKRRGPRGPDHRPAVRFTGGRGRSLADDRWPSAVAGAASALVAVLVAWCLLYVNVTPALMAVPGGSVASVFLLYVVSVVAGQAVAAVGGLPPLLGMMVAGIALQNCGLYTVTADWCVHLVSIMRCAYFLFFFSFFISKCAAVTVGR